MSLSRMETAVYNDFIIPSLYPTNSTDLPKRDNGFGLCFSQYRACFLCIHSVAFLLQA